MADKKSNSDRSKTVEKDTVIIGYKLNRPKQIATWSLIILSLGLLRILFYWKPSWFLFCTHTQCQQHEASRVLITDQYGQIFVENIKRMQNFALLPTTQSYTLKSYEKYFWNKKIKYVLYDGSKSFQPQRGLEDELKYSDFHNMMGLTDEEHHLRLLLYGLNKIVVRVTPVLKLLFSQVLNPFYVFQIFSITLWYLDEYEIYATTLLIISSASISIQVYQTRAMQRALKSTVSKSDRATVLRNDEEIEVSSDELVPGDVMLIGRYGCDMHCDAVLVHGTCVVNESMLTGESVPVTKTSLQETNKGKEDTFILKEQNRHVLFCGTKVIQARTHDKDKVRVVVIRTGFTTAKGELTRSILFPKPTEFRFSQDAFKFVGILFLLSLVGIGYTFAIMIQRGFPWHRVLVRGLDLVTIVVPPALPAAITVGIVYAQARLKKWGIYCISTNSINPCGALNLVCFDKTGTLTEDGLDLWGIVPCYDGNLEPVEQRASVFGRELIAQAMATCHSLAIVNGEITGDPLDVKMFQAIGWNLEENWYDESRYGVNMPFVVRPPYTSSQKLAGNISKTGDFEVGILRQFPFTSKLQRMSVIVKRQDIDQFTLFAKGSPEMIASLCDEKSIPSGFHDILMEYTQQGYRVIALAYKKLVNVDYLKAMKLERHQAESKLCFLGLLVMENRIKQETAPTISELKVAKIRPVMVTGDNILTGISVARKCGMILPDDDVFLAQVLPPNTKESGSKAVIKWSRVPNEHEYTSSNTKFWSSNMWPPIDGDQGPSTHVAMTGKSWNNLRLYMPEEMEKILVRGTIFARMSPEQKQQLVEAFQDIDYYVGMCGDGANDCGALKTAHAGISLSETEASVASPFTSKRPNISCVPKVIREGRAALVTSIGIFKYMACYSLTMFTSVCMLYWFGANLTSFGYLYIDLILITTLSVTFGYTKAFDTLVATPPRVSLLSIIPIVSIIGQIGINSMVQLLIWYSVQQQPWYEPYVIDPSDYYKFETHVVTAVFCVSTFQYIILAIVFSKGPPYKHPFYTNPDWTSRVRHVLEIKTKMKHLEGIVDLEPITLSFSDSDSFEDDTSCEENGSFFLTNILLCILLSIIICTIEIPLMGDLIQLVLSPSIAYRWVIIGVACANCIVSFIFEVYIVDSRLLSRVETSLTSEKHKSSFRKIEDTLESKWPPLVDESTTSFVKIIRQESNVLEEHVEESIQVGTDEEMQQGARSGGNVYIDLEDD